MNKLQCVGCHGRVDVDRQHVVYVIQSRTGNFLYWHARCYKRLARRY